MNDQTLLKNSLDILLNILGYMQEKGHLGLEQHEVAEKIQCWSNIVFSKAPSENNKRLKNTMYNKTLSNKIKCSDML